MTDPDITRPRASAAHIRVRKRVLAEPCAKQARPIPVSIATLRIGKAIPKPTPAHAGASNADVLDRSTHGPLKAALDGMKGEMTEEERCEAGIYQLIVEGVTTESPIVSAMTRLGFERKYAAFILKGRVRQSNPSRPWRRNADGHFELVRP